MRHNFHLGRRWYARGLPTQQMPSIGIGEGDGLIIFTTLILFNSWRTLPYHVNLSIWFEFYTRLTIFVQQRRNATLYIHAYVNLPWMTITQSIRKTMYGMFSRNIPTEVMLCVREIKFRLLLLPWLRYDAEDEVIINKIGRAHV